MTNKQIVIATRNRIKNPDNWCQNNVAVDVNGAGTYTQNPKACKWCVYGALLRSVRDSLQKPKNGCQVDRITQSILRDIQTKLNISLVHYNDNHTHTEVISMLDKYIALCPN